MVMTRMTSTEPPIVAANTNPAVSAHTASREDWRENIPTSLWMTALTGLLIIGVFFAGFGYWAFRAPLAGAAIAPGIVVASGQNQQIGHLEGGIIRDIAVIKGQAVTVNQPLVFLDETQAQSSRNRVDQSIVSLTASQERAMAELSGKEKISFSENLIAKAREAGRENILDLQRAEFRSRLQQHTSELNVLKEQMSAVEEEIQGINRQIEAENTNLLVLTDQITTQTRLLDRGVTPKNQYNALLRSQADSEGAVGRLTATIGQRRKAISELKERQTALRASRQAEASTQISEARQQVADLQEQLTARADILERMIIRAPVDGVIVNISKNTIGSVVAPGETVLEILPTSKGLVISARVPPQDVDVVKIGQEASIRFVALNARTTPEVPAMVEYISADRLIDPATQEPYFDARLKLADELPSEFSLDQIYPGMPVDAFIKTGDRTFVEYLVKPVTDSFSKAFREE